MHKSFEDAVDEQARRREIVGSWLLTAAVVALLIGAAVGVVIWRR